MHVWLLGKLGPITFIETKAFLKIQSLKYQEIFQKKVSGNHVKLSVTKAVRILQ